MSESGTSPQKAIGTLTAAIAAVFLAYWSFQKSCTTAEIKLGYYCLSCKQTENITAYRQDDNWKQYPGGGSDSVLYCIKCKKGRAHPVNECESCSTVFVLHLFPKYDEFGSPACPKCDSAYGAVAKSKGVDLMPKELNP